MNLPPVGRQELSRDARDTTLVFASRAPQAEIARLKERMGWDIPWYTITDSFDVDSWNYLDITALGRQETWEDSPEGYPQTPPYGWWNRHDEYDETA